MVSSFRVTQQIWHCDALGVYSHYTSAGVGGLNSSRATDNSTFLRGVQLSDQAGLVGFDTIFPGYYVGRDTHIHLKVHLNGSLAAVNQTSTGLENDDVNTNQTTAYYYYAGGSVVHTGQLFFEDAVSDAIDALAPYSTNPGNRTLLDEDNIYAGVTNASYGLLDVAYRNSSQGYAGGLVATIILGIDTSARPPTTRAAQLAAVPTNRCPREALLAAPKPHVP
ncbi:protocatechuate dioxygenase [Acanthamoeba castellanii str. Neff]|uniref:Protocatechuate dioxygenase n=1 Tax=Acanthamoeba castellanii (strain ATCC 30010 / Neff) TaxID=1257118 RepID=L8GLE3_ACACF|nr:protocatechuate dioxygenase [Acanthamoeba castellanii str. Neff]ELR13895.1 protocatechuate dioxygenase [Acanthamoeba castellanii str. Neff]